MTPLHPITRELSAPFPLSPSPRWGVESTTRGRAANGRAWKSTYVHTFVSEEEALRWIKDQSK